MKFPNFLVLVTLLLLVFFIYLIFFKTKNNPSLNGINLQIKQTNYQLEIANTILAKAKGLGSRTNLCSNCGMIFVFNYETSLPFWMKDTLIPLDMIWLNSQGKVVSIKTAAPEPGKSSNQLKIYQNDLPAKYVIELNAGDAQKIGLYIGDIITLPSL